MDINYLLWLQGIRESMNGALDDFFVWYSDIVDSHWMLIIVALIYWVLNKRMGEIFFSTYALGQYVNGIIKLTACVYRPWILDSRIVPVPGAGTSATGYSFPSGHATRAAAYFGTGAVWQWKERRWLSIILIFLMLLTMFSRNYLGVHTPQDVLVGAGVTLLIAALAFRIQALREMGVVTDQELFIGALTLIVLGAVYLSIKTYPMDYVDGELVVDPEKMKTSTYKAFGELIGAAGGIYIERRWIKLEEAKDKIKRLVLAVIACVPLYFIQANLRSALIPGIGKNAAGLFAQLFTMLYCLVLVPVCIKKIEKQAAPQAQ